MSDTIIFDMFPADPDRDVKDYIFLIQGQDISTATAHLFVRPDYWYYKKSIFVQQIYKNYGK